MSEKANGAGKQMRPLKEIEEHLLEKLQHEQVSNAGLIRLIRNIVALGKC